MGDVRMGRKERACRRREVVLQGEKSVRRESQKCEQRNRRGIAKEEERETRGARGKPIGGGKQQGDCDQRMPLGEEGARTSITGRVKG